MHLQEPVAESITLRVLFVAIAIILIGLQIVSYSLLTVVFYQKYNTNQSWIACFRRARLVCTLFVSSTVIVADGLGQLSILTLGEPLYLAIPHHLQYA